MSKWAHFTTVGHAKCARVCKQTCVDVTRLPPPFRTHLQCNSCPYLAGRITLAIPIIGGCLYVFTMGALLRTTFTDPGVIPRASQDEAAYIEKQIGSLAGRSPVHRSFAG